jgi:hypothetical protein
MSKKPIPSKGSEPDMWTDEEPDTVGSWVSGLPVEITETEHGLTPSLEACVETFADRCFTDAENLGWHKSYDKLLRDVQNGAALEDFASRTEDDYLAWIQSKMLLIVGEVCEAQEELRNGRDVKEVYYKDVDGNIGPKDATYSQQAYGTFGVAGGVAAYIFGEPRGDKTVPLLKPEGWLVEMADAMIRIGDLVGTIAGQEGVMFGPIVSEKLQYNGTRGQMHGGKKF